MNLQAVIASSQHHMMREFDNWKFSIQEILSSWIENFHLHMLSLPARDCFLPRSSTSDLNVWLTFIETSAGCGSRVCRNAMLRRRRRGLWLIAMRNVSKKKSATKVSQIKAILIRADFVWVRIVISRFRCDYYFDKVCCLRWVHLGRRLVLPSIWGKQSVFTRMAD